MNIKEAQELLGHKYYIECEFMQSTNEYWAHIFSSEKGNVFSMAAFSKSESGSIKKVLKLFESKIPG